MQFWIYILVYKISQTRELVFESFGSWTKGDGFLDHRISPINSRRRFNLNGEKLVLCIAIPNRKTQDFK